MQGLKSTLFYILKFTVYIFLTAVLFLLFYNFFNSFYQSRGLRIELKGTDLGSRPLEVYYAYGEDGNVDPNRRTAIDSENTAEFTFSGTVIPPRDGARFIMLQFGDNPMGEVRIKRLRYKDSGGYASITDKELKQAAFNEMEYRGCENGETLLAVKANSPNAVPDPYIVVPLPPLTPYKNYSLPLAAAAALAAAFIIHRYVRIKAVVAMAGGLYQNRRLIMSLAVNDFKTKYAGSYFGIIWAFVQPICTILVFWFVFQVGFRNADVDNVPYIVWLMCGIIPWFFYSEAWGSATSALLEYGFLVKKMVFQVHILPLVKIISAFFVHAFFICFMVCVFLLYGMTPNIYWLQVLYYCLCMVMLVIALSFITTPLMVFFRDLGQIMNIILQFGMWLTPIMWNINTIGIPAGYIKIFKLNPMYYVVQGYRDSFIYGVPFYNNIKQTIYFWVAALLLLLAGSIIFRRLKPHFVDVM